MTRTQAVALAQHAITRRVTPLAEWERRHQWYGAWLKARAAEDAKTVIRRVK